MNAPKQHRLILAALALTLALAPLTANALPWQAFDGAPGQGQAFLGKVLAWVVELWAPAPAAPEQVFEKAWTTGGGTSGGGTGGTGGTGTGGSGSSLDPNGHA